MIYSHSLVTTFLTDDYPACKFLSLLVLSPFYKLHMYCLYDSIDTTMLLLYVS